MKLVICAVVAYLIGSINIAILLARKTYNKDIREYGSGNAGSTNMVRTFGWKAGIMTFVCDVIKSAIAVAIGKYFCGDAGVLACASAVVIGNNWPIFFKFKGGKGAAATVGSLLVFMTVPTIVIVIICITIIALTRIVSIASLVGASLVVVAAFVFLMDRPLLLAAALVMVILLFFQHRENIKRLITKSENKI